MIVRWIGYQSSSQHTSLFSMGGEWVLEVRYVSYAHHSTPSNVDIKSRPVYITAEKSAMTFPIDKRQRRRIMPKMNCRRAPPGLLPATDAHVTPCRRQQRLAEFALKINGFRFLAITNFQVLSPTGHFIRRSYFIMSLTADAPVSTSILP